MATSKGGKKPVVRIVDYPARVSSVVKVSAPKHWHDLWGTTVVLANGDSFGVWSQDLYEIEMFAEGVTLVYELRKEITAPGLPGEKIKLRLASYEFIIPRAQRYELHVPLKLAESVAHAASVAQGLMAQSGRDINDFPAVADMVHEWMRGKFIGMEFSLEENFIDAKKIIEDGTKKEIPADQAPDSGSRPSDEDGAPKGGKGRKKLGGSKTPVQKE